MIVGGLGDIAFQVTANTVRTFDGLNWSSTAKYAVHDRHLKDDLLEFLGCEPEKISFKMQFLRSLGIDPAQEYEKLKKALQSGEIMIFTIGTKKIGKYRWVIKSLKNDIRNFDGFGRVIYSEVDVELQEYPKK